MLFNLAPGGRSRRLVVWFRSYRLVVTVDADCLSTVIANSWPCNRSGGTRTARSGLCRKYILATAGRLTAQTHTAKACRLKVIVLIKNNKSLRHVSATGVILRLKAEVFDPCRGFRTARPTRGRGAPVFVTCCFAIFWPILSDH